ncbi:intraflagellar transport protein 140 homolog [Planococcus citri]|uniref:intraflagellar transport protein 140 homolog n=1 Tax=Planococcus citri TaxID=170843 RepID=UPI0031F9BA4B
MSVYFDFKVNTRSGNFVSYVQWHNQLPLLAVGTRTLQPLTTYVTVFDQLGEALADVNELYQENNDTVVLSWHPNKKILTVGLTSGDIQLWNGQSDFINVPSSHKTCVKILKWSELGTRLISMDESGNIVAWKTDSRSLIVRIFQSSVQGIPFSIEYCNTKPGLDVNSLARKAVEGDEKALDMFSAWRPKTGGFRPTFSTDNVCFYAATLPDDINYVNENGTVSNVSKMDNDIKLILHHDRKNILIVMLIDGSLNTYNTEVDGKLKNIGRVKLNDVDNDSVLIWAGDDLLACTTNTYTIRFFEVESTDTYLLHGTFGEEGEPQKFTTVSYLDSKGILCGGSDTGNITMWKKNHAAVGVNCWEEISTCKLKDSALYSSWGSQHSVIVTENSLFILQEHELSSNYNKRVCGVQTSANEVIVSRKKTQIKLNTDLKIIGVAVSEDHVAVWSGKTVAVYQFIGTSSLNVLGTFNSECESLVIYEQSLVILPSSVLQNGKLLICTFQGTVKQNLDCDGQPIAIHLNQSYLIAATIIGMLQIWDLSRREAKSHAHPKDLVEAISDFGEVVLIRTNCNGSMVSFTIANSNLIPSPFIYIWDIESDQMLSYQFNETDLQNSGYKKYITGHYWDSSEPNMLICETKTLTEAESAEEPSKEESLFSSENKTSRNLPKLNTLFISKEKGVVLQDTKTTSTEFIKLLGVDIPYFVTLKKSATDTYACVQNLLMNYFEEESADDDVLKNAIIKFSFNLSIGNLDDAFKTISTIKNVAVWTNLTRMSIKKRRLDVAQVCLGHMNDARGVSILRTISSESQIEVKLAALAIHMGMLEDAEAMYKSAKRYDLLNKMYQCANRWDEAILLAEKKNRINLRNTYDAYGRYLEKKGDIHEAIKMYEMANTYRKHVPKLLLHNPVALEQYVQKSKDPALMKWWAQYVESTRNMELAMKYYEEAKDYYSIVRIHCFLQNIEQAAEVADTSNDPAACYHLARHYESVGQTENAVNFFLKSNGYANAIRICKENGLDDQLWQISLHAEDRDKLETAKYFEGADPTKAVMLYQKAKNFHRALHLAIKFDLADSVEQISSELNSESQIDLLDKCAEYFARKEDYHRAVKLLAMAKKYKEAVTLCHKRRVNLTEELGDLLTPPPNYPDKIPILDQIGEYAFTLGDYHLAAKKFTQAGNKVKAMKALLKSGDTDKIIFFTNVSREKEIYIMAANYLQTLDWQIQPEYLKHIVNFYTKGKAPHLLANFYVACAQVEVDEYGNYEKSLGALNEASRCLSKDRDQYGQALEYVVRKIAMVKKFLEIRRLYEKGEGEAAMLQCRQLLSADLELVRKGDIYSLMIEHLMKNNNLNAATQLAIEMKKNLPNDNLAYFVPKEALQKLGIEESSNDGNNFPDDLDEIPDITQ